MKKNLKITLAIIISVLLAISCGAVAAFAATTDEAQASSGKVARIGAEGTGTYYTSLSDAYNAANDGDVITVIKDTSAIPTQIHKKVTFTSENGSTVTFGSQVHIGVADSATVGELTIAGNLRINATKNDTIMVNSGTLNITEDAYLSLSDNTIINFGTNGNGSLMGTYPATVNISGGTLECSGKDNYGIIGVYRNNCTVNITGGELVQKNSGGRILTLSPSSNSVVNISGGELINNAGGGLIYTHTRWSYGSNANNNTDTKATININGGDLTCSGSNLIYVCHNYVDINISGGNLTTTGSTVIKSDGGNTDINISGDAYLEAKNMTIRPNNGTNITISGGEVKATDDSTIYLDGKSNVKVDITGGKVTATNSAIKDVNTNSNTQVNISGGEVAATYMTIATYGSGMTYNISGGTISSVNDSTLYIDQSNNQYNISGGTITAPIAAIKSVNTNKGSVVTISDNAVVQATGTPAEGVVGTIEDPGTGYVYNIKGGTISGKYGTIHPGKNSVFNISGGTISAENDSTIYIDGTKTVTMNISGGKVTAPTATIKAIGTLTIDFNISGGIVEATTGEKAIWLEPGTGDTNLNVSGDALITAAGAYGAILTDVDFTMTGGTIEANAFTISFNKGTTNTANISGGTIIAKEQVAINTISGAVLEANISGDAKLYAGKKVFDVKVNQTINVSGGLIDVANTYPMADDAYGIVMNKAAGKLNITGGTFILGGTCSYAQMIYQASDNTEAEAVVNGGLFVNKNTANTVVFGPNVTYISGRVLYGENIVDIRIGKQAAPKSLQVLYGEGDDLYYFFTRFEATDPGLDANMKDGASVRLTADSTGLRFTSTFEEIEGATYGTIILPARYLANLTSFTKAELDAKGILYSDILASAGMDVVDGKVTIRAAITNLDPNNYDTAFAAIAYVIIDGVYYYTEFDVEDNVRTVDTVSRAALDDTRSEKGEYENTNYVNQMVDAYGQTVYSPYNAEQRAILEGFVVNNMSLPTMTGASLMNNNDGSYQYYAKNVSADAYKAYKKEVEATGFIQAL